ncbi:MAG: histidine--tRNA ligase [Elusimicrobiota bacterium]|jgi:histidyl-tRNA synthetase
MSEIPTTPPSGFRDFLPEACVIRSRAVQTISQVYRSYGFSPIATPAVEDLAVLTGKGGGENEKLIFKILKRGEKLDLALGSAELADMGLRFDLTLPLARFYSRHRGVLPTPFKAFQIGPVWRAERAQKGRYREFFQCDADIIGSESPYCEVEVISAVLSAFQTLGLALPAVVLNDRGLIFALLDEAGVPPQERNAVCILLDKLDKVERATVMSELEALISPASAQALQATIFAAQPDLERMRRVAPEATARLETILVALRGIWGDTVKFDLLPSLVRGFDYYTGPVFEFRDPRLAGSLGGGGRYDGLTEKFGGQKTPACGVSIGFERLMLIMEQSGQHKAAGPDACLTVFSEELRLESLRLAALLRAEGLSIDVYPGTGKLKAQFKYADSRQARFALVLGPDEAAIKKVKLKNLATGEEALACFPELVAALKR